MATELTDWLPAATLAHTADYNCLDCLVTSRVGDHLEAEGGIKASLFDQALLGPSLTCTLRGLRVDYARLLEARDAVAQDIILARQRFNEACGGEWKWGRGAKPSPLQLASLLYGKFKVRVRLGNTDSPSVAKDKLQDILEDPRTPEEAVPVIETALELSKLEEDRKALDNPLSPDGRLHCSFLVAAQVSGRWSGRKDSFNRGIALYGASKPIRSIVIPDPGYILVSMDQAQAESKLIAYLAGSQWYIDAHERPGVNVHVESGKIFFPEHAAVMSKQWVKDNKFPHNPSHDYYYYCKRLQHGNNYMQSPAGVARQLHIPQQAARVIQRNYFSRMPELPAYHLWVAGEIKAKRRLISPMGRVRQFLGRVWENSAVREAVSWQPQSGVSDFTKCFLYRLWKHLDPHDLQVLFEHHDSVVFQVPESRLDEVMPRVIALSDIQVPIGPRVMRVKWEAKVGDSWDAASDVSEEQMRKWGWEG